MRKEFILRSILSFLIFIFILFFSINTNPKSGKVQNSGTYTVGTGGEFSSFTNDNGFFSAINSGIVTGNLIAEIISDITEEGKITLTHKDNGYTLLIKPKTATVKIISGSSSSNALFWLNGADGVTIDGSFNGSGKYLTIRNNHSSNSTIRISNDANNNTIKNCIIEGSVTDANYGVVYLAAGSATRNCNNSISNNIIRGIDNNNIPANLIYSGKVTSGLNNEDNIISNNKMYDFSNSAVFLSSYGNKDWIISENDIYQTSSRSTGLNAIVMSSEGENYITKNIIRDLNTSGGVIGIRLYNVKNTTISKNKMYSFQSSSSTPINITGILFEGYNSSDINLNITNNFISLNNGISNNNIISGIRNKGFSGNSIKVYNNTIYIGGTSSGTSNSWAYFRQNGCPTTSTIKNNIFFNGRTGGSANHFAIGDESAGTGSFTVSNNLYLGTGSTPDNFMERANSESVTPRSFSYWVTYANDPYSYGETASAITSSDLFNDISTGDLSIKSSTSTSTCWAVNGKGVSLSEVQEDYFGNSRTTTSGVPIDIGAHEFQTTEVPTAITITPVNGDNHFNFLGRTLATINFSQNGTLPTSLNLQYYSGVQAPNSNSNCINSHWIITPVGGSGYNYSLKLNTVPSEHNQIVSNTFKVAKSNDNGNSWSIIPGTISGNSITISGQTSFSHFTVTNNDTPFPIKLLYLKNSVNKNNLRLNWQTSEELNNSGFEIERKSGNENWSKIGFVKGNNKPSEYYFEDKNLSTGIYNYRLKQIDYNGNFEYFELNNIIEIEKPEKFELSQNYPNPFNAKTVINWQIPKSGNVSIKIYDITGKEIYTLINGYNDAGYYTTNFDASKLSSGIYFYRMVSGNFSKTEKLLLIK